jgi:uncharacterized protein involved in exopolysaccharide biosynthesis
MRQLSEPMTLKELAILFYQWRRIGFRVFVSGLVIGGLWVALRPLTYESQAILERKPPKLAPQLDAQEKSEFDVYRLTSESQRCVALMKSHYLLERWYEALGLPAKTAKQKEKGMKPLQDSLTVQPVSYTDLFMVKVRAHSPEEAEHRAAVLIDSFSRWDLEQDRQEAQQLVNLLNARLAELTRELVQGRARLQSQKSSLSLSLAGSATARQLEADITAKTSLYDQLTTELEGAQRALSNDAVPRTRVLAPPSTPGTPIFSRKGKGVIVVCLSLLMAGLAMWFLEWSRRAGIPADEWSLTKIAERSSAVFHVR